MYGKLIEMLNINHSLAFFYLHEENVELHRSERKFRFKKYVLFVLVVWNKHNKSIELKRLSVSIEVTSKLSVQW